MTQVYEPELMEDSPGVMSPGAVQAITQAEVDVAISTAHRFPRNLAKFKNEAMSMVTADPETAAACYYRLKRREKDGTEKVIEGSSIRMAEIVASCWGNLRSGVRIISEDDRFITAQGVAHDLERNNYITQEVRRRITTKGGQKYSDDMIGTTANAAGSIALRNAILRVVPRTYTDELLKAAKRVALGSEAALKDRIQKAIEWWGKGGVSKEQILAKQGKASIDELTRDDLEDLIGYATAIHDGLTTFEETFPPLAKPEEKKAEGEAPKKEPETKTEGLGAKLKGRAKAKKEEAAPDPEPEKQEGPTAEDLVDALYQRAIALVGKSDAQLELLLSEATAGKLQKWHPAQFTPELFQQVDAYLTEREKPV